jgi:ABC-type molybdate transport system substrate-binding protein
MTGKNMQQWTPGVASAAVLMTISFAAYAGGDNQRPPPGKKTNINLAVASNFYGQPPSNSAITDLINEFEADNPNYTVTVTDNGATATLAANIINGNKAKVDLFLAADTATPLDLYLNHFKLVAAYNTSDNSSYVSTVSWPKPSSFTPPLYLFDYATGVLALLINTPGIDLSCDPGGTCGYDPNVFKTVGIAEPSLAPYGVAAQSVLTGTYGLMPPLCNSTNPPASGNPLVKQPCYQNITAVLTAVLNRDPLTIEPQPI